MREKKAAYNLISNNCQTFAVLLLDAIKVGAHKKFATTFQVYKTATGLGNIKGLFVPDGTEPVEDDTLEGEDDAVTHAQHVMDENTTQLDHHTHA